MPGYLAETDKDVLMLWRGKREGENSREREERRDRSRGSREVGKEAEAASPRGSWKRENLAASLPQGIGEGVGMTSLLKRQNSLYNGDSFFGLNNSYFHNRPKPPPVSGPAPRQRLP